MGLDAGDRAPHDIAEHGVGVRAAVPRTSKTVCEFFALGPESAVGIGFGHRLDGACVDHDGVLAFRRDRTAAVRSPPWLRTAKASNLL